MLGNARVLALGVVDVDASDHLGFEARADAARAEARAHVAHGGGEEADRLAVVAHVVGGGRPIVLGVAHEVVVAERGIGVERQVEPLAGPERATAAPPLRSRQLDALVDRARRVTDDRITQVGVELPRVDQLVREVHAEQRRRGAARLRAATESELVVVHALGLDERIPVRVEQRRALPTPSPS